MEEAKQEIKKIKEILLIKNIKIPEYQRPYKWKANHVTQLLDDIYEHVILQEKSYRIGSLILHENNKKVLDIVDGQQRLTTLSILFKALEVTDGLLLNEKYKHKISQNNIVYNYRVIKNWLQKITDKDTFRNKLINNCEFVLFTVYNQDEAFQLFDSQNSRGKGLEPYDLLKAFHLREMENNSEEEKAFCVKQWEDSIENNTLKPIFDNHLFKIRKWSKNQKKYSFTKEDINEFKGISLHKEQLYPFENTLRYLDGLIENTLRDKLLKNLNIAQSYPFSITMPIINGKRFFEYVNYYIELNESIYQKNDFKRFYDKYCKNYYGDWRTGDIKVRNLYENIILHFVDKFGINEEFENFYEAFYKATYIIRCNSKSISENSILKDKALKIFETINHSNSTSPLRKYIYKKYSLEDKQVKGIDAIKFFIQNGYDFNKAITQISSEHKLNLDIKDDYLISLNNIPVYIGDKKNPYWYGVKESDYKILNPEIQQKLDDYFKKFQETQKNENWIAWKEFKPMTKENLEKVIQEIKALEHILS